MGALHEGQFVFFESNLAQLLEWEMFQKKVVEKMKAHFKFSNPPPEKHAIYENVGKYCTAGLAADDNMAHAHYVNT